MHKLGKVPNLHVQIRQDAKFLRANLQVAKKAIILANFGTIQIWALKFSSVLNLYAKIRQGAKFVRENLQVAKKSYNFGTFQIWALKFGNMLNLYTQKLIVPKYCLGLKKCTNLVHCQICAHKFGKLAKFVHFYREEKKVYKFGKVPNL